MNGRAIRAIVRKDLKVVTKSKPVMIPIIILPLIMLVVLPAVMSLGPSLAEGSGSSIKGMDTFLANMPQGMLTELAGFNEKQKVIALSLLYIFAPLYLIVPLMVASVIAADSFAGEKERKTLEALLYTPTTDRELFIAKLFSAWIPAIVIGLIGFVIYGTVANLAAWPVMERIFFPNTMWLVLAFWVSPAVAGLGLGATVLVSARVQTFQEAYQMGGMVVLPVVALMIGQISGVMYLNVASVFILGLVLWTIDAIILWYGGKTFQRSELIAKV